MKKILSLSALAAFAATAFTGCVTKVGVDNPIDTDGYWNNFVTGTLTTKYTGKTLEEVFKAASLGLEQYTNGKRVGENRPDPKNTKAAPSYEIIARADGDIRISVLVSTAKDQRTKAEWTQVTVQYGSFGNLKESQRIVHYISKNL